MPLSSKTMVMLILMAFGLSPKVSYDLAILLNGATALSALLYFKKDFLKMLKCLVGLGSGPDDRRDLLFFSSTTLITALVGVPLYFTSKSIASAGGLITTTVASVLMLLMGALARRRESLMKGGTNRRDELRLRDSPMVGVSQGLSALPGVSRSGITLASLMALGYANESSLRVSFVAGVPVSLGGAFLSMMEGRGVVALEMGLLSSALMFSVATLTGILSIDRLMKLALRVRFSTFNLLLGSLGLLSALVALALAF